jgi:hypothetical protein
MKNKILEAPATVQKDAQAVQVLSAWVAGKSLHYALDATAWKAGGRDEPAMWGLLLAGAVRQVADAMRASEGADRDETMEGIVDAMLESLNDPKAGNALP